MQKLFTRLAHQRPSEVKQLIAPRDDERGREQYRRRERNQAFKQELCQRFRDPDNDERQTVPSIAKMLSLKPSRVRYLSKLHLRPAASSVPMSKDP